MMKLKGMVRYSILILFIFSGMASDAQLNAGPVVSYVKTSRGIEGKTASAIFDIRVYSDDIIRVRLTRNKTFNTVNYALDEEYTPESVPEITDKGNSIEITTHTLVAVIEKKPVFRVQFKNKAGVVINEDVAGDAFGTSFNGNKVTIYKKMQEGERFVGLGETLGNLDKRGSGFTLNNTDTYKYGDPRLSLYISIPFYIGIHDQQVYGLFYNNTFKSFFNFGLSTPFTSVAAEGGDADYFFLYGSSVGDVLKNYSSVTGRMPLPPLWSLGYHQSRCSYFPQEKVEWLAETFRKKKIPVDGIVLDADYQQDYQPFRTNLKRFPDMPGLSAKLAKLNIELTASVYPGVRIDSTYHSYTDGLNNDVFIKYKDGSLFKTEIAPLKIVLPDYTKPDTRRWWVGKMKWMQDNGISGYWNDMNEPAVGGSYLPDNLAFDFDGRKAEAAEAKNVYGLLMARSSFEAAKEHRGGKRPFILTRSAFAGVQRYAAVWSGDNTASDEGLLSGVLLNNQMGLSGIPFVGPDLGGYIGDGTKDLFKRWMEVGVFSPYVRNHKEYFATANEPWSYGEEAEAISKTYIGLRYRLMPYIYTAFNEASQTGMPVARSLCINYPFDDKVYDNTFQYQFLFGDALMVTPVTSKESQKKVYLPKGDWFDLFTEERFRGEREVIRAAPIYQLPVFVKASSIIPMQSLVQSSKDKPSDTLYIHVFNGDSSSRYNYYEDRGEGYDYLLNYFCKRTFDFNPAERKITVGEQNGTVVSKFASVQFIFHGFDQFPEKITTSLRLVKGGPEDRSISHSAQVSNVIKVGTQILDPLENLSDIYDPAYYRSLKEAAGTKSYPSVTVPFSKGTIQVIW